MLRNDLRRWRVPGAGSDLEELLGATGGTFLCAFSAESGAVLASIGESPERAFGPAGAVATTAAAAMARAAADLGDARSGDPVDDVMVGTRRAYHLLRTLDRPGRPGVVVYVLLRRGRGNVAAARRELASPAWQRSLLVALDAAAVADRVPRPRGPQVQPHPAGPSARGEPTPPARRPLKSGEERPVRSGDRAPAGAGRRAREVPPEAPADPEPLRVVPARAPRPERRAPAADPPPVTATPPAPPAALPRRARGGHLPPGARRAPEQPPPPDAVPPVLDQRWARDIGTLRRLVEGLRRLT